MRKLYFISGLGADEKAFHRLEDFGVPKIMVQWLDPIPKESLLNYCKRIITQYGITQQDIIVGLSFGGLIAQQIAQILDQRFVILISSFRTKEDLRLLFKKGLQFRLYKLMPEIKFPLISEVVANVLNSGTTEGKPVLKAMLETTDMKLLKWSIEKIFQQDIELGQEAIKYNLLGNKDRVMKIWRNKTTHIIQGGSHFMVYDKAKEVSTAIKQILESSHP